MKIAVALLLYKRPEHAVQVIESLVHNGVRHCLAFMDGWDSEDIRQKQELMVDYINNHKSIHVELTRSPTRRGLARSVVSSVSSVLQEYDGVVFLEDDCVLRPMAMQYFEEGLTQLKNNANVRSVCGYLYPVPFFSWNGNPELLLLKRFNTWGWATWKDRWQDYDTDLRSLVGRLNEQDINLDNAAGDIAALCRSQRYLNGEVDIWSLNWSLLHYLTETYAVYPRESLIRNIGFDGSGQNCVVTHDFDPIGGSFSLVQRNWQNLCYDSGNELKVKRFMDQNSLKIFPAG